MERLESTSLTAAPARRASEEGNIPGSLQGADPPVSLGERSSFLQDNDIVREDKTSLRDTNTLALCPFSLTTTQLKFPAGMSWELAVGRSTPGHSIHVIFLFPHWIFCCFYFCSTEAFPECLRSVLSLHCALFCPCLSPWRSPCSDCVPT